MSRVNYEVTVAFETDNLSEARQSVLREMFKLLDTRPDVKAVGIIDVEEANRDAALFLSEKKAKEQLIDFDFEVSEDDKAYIEETEFVANCLLEASEFGLEDAVTHWALQEMKQNPNLSISDAIWIGLNEWVK